MMGTLFLGIFCIILILVLIVISVLFYMAIRSGFVQQEQIKEYEDFISKISSILEEDIDFLRGSLAQKLSMDIPEVQDLYRGLTRLQTDIARVKESALRMETKHNE